MMIAYVIAFSVVVFSSFYLYNYWNNDDGKYYYTTVFVHQFDKIDEKTGKKARDSIEVSRFYYDIILDEMCFDDDLDILDSEVQDNPVTCLEIRNKYRVAFTKAVINNIPDSIKDGQEDNIKEFVEKMFDQFAKEEISIKDGKRWTKRDHDFHTFLIQIQSAMFRTFKKIVQCNKDLLLALTAKLSNDKATTLADKNFGSTHEKGKSLRADYNFQILEDMRTYELKQKLGDIYYELRYSDKNHFVIDLTDLYLDNLQNLITNLRTKGKIEQEVLRSYEKSVLSRVDSALRSIYGVLDRLRRCKHQLITIHFDTFKILESAAMGDCSETEYRAITSSFKAILAHLKESGKNFQIGYATFTTEVLDINVLFRLKLLSHTSTQLMFEKIEEHLKHNRSPDKDTLLKVKELRNSTRSSRWFFDGSLFDGITGIETDTIFSGDSYTLVAFYYMNSRLIVDTCLECSGKQSNFCEKCKDLTKHFKHISLLSGYYKSLLKQKTLPNYFLNMDELVNYGNEDKEKMSIQSAGIDISYLSLVLRSENAV